MGGDHRGPGRDRLPWGFLGMFGLVLAVELWVARHDADFTSVLAADWQQAGRAARHQAVGCDVLCFGSSLVKFGAVPEVMERRLGGRAYNLAVSAGHPPTSYILFRRALASGARPAAVVVDFSPYHLTVGSRANDRFWPELASLRECLELAWTARDANFFATLATAKLLPSARARHEVRANVLRALRGEWGTSRFDLMRYRRNWDVNRGTQLMPGDDRLRRGDPASAIVRLGTGRMFDEVHAAYIAKFLDLAAERGITTYVLMPPSLPCVQATREATGADAVVTRSLRALRDCYPGLVILDGRRAGFPDTAFADMTHLDRRGACMLTAALAETIGRCRAGSPEVGRWVDLPTYRDRPAEIAAEDLDQSRLALRSRYTRRR